MSITLQKEDTLRIIYENFKLQNYDVKHTYTVSYPWHCLNCFEDIYISYRQFSNIAIFCENCKSHANDITKESKIVQFQYMRRVKENQIKLINSFFKENELNINL